MRSTVKGIAIRRMKETDLPVVFELAPLANPHATSEYGRFISEELIENPDLSFVAIKDRKVVGYAMADIHGNKEAVLEDIVVAEKNQKRGVGKLLLNKTVEALKKKGAVMIFAEVHCRCGAAIPFYYKHGFRISGFGQDYFGIGHDAIVLKRVL